MSTKKVTIKELQAARRRNERVAFVTAYDYPTACFADRAGVHMLLVGDSAAMTMLGLPTTVGITLDEMLVFARAVCRGVKRALVIGDLPFMSYQPSDERAVLSAGAFISAGCDAVKCEGGLRVVSRVRAMVDAGISVMGHLGLTPQNLSQLGGYRVQGKSLREAQALIDDARALEAAGVFAILLEAMPAATAALIRDEVGVPVYGIGAGPEVNGQLVICHDMLGSFVGEIKPRFVKQYANVGVDTQDAFSRYVADVSEGRFPAPEHCYPIESDNEAAIRKRQAHERKALGIVEIVTGGREFFSNEEPA
jgi:3-methyl-2-oxobutanoate hydroxymethyltransferase